MFVRRLIVSIVLIVLLLSGGISTSIWLHETKPQADQTAEPVPPPRVSVVTMTPSDVREYFVGYGSARAERDVIIAAEVSGVVTSLAPELNDGVTVTKGQSLVRLDDRQYRHVLARADAAEADLNARIEQLDVEQLNTERLARIAEREVEVNRSEFERLSGLYEKNHASKKEYDFARLEFQRSNRQLQTFQNTIDLIEPRRKVMEASRASTRADAELAKLDIERCDIRAPFDGQVDRVEVDAGDHVMPGKPIVRLMATRLIEIPIELPASVRFQVMPGTECVLESDTMAGVQWSGSVARIAPLADERSRTFSAYVEVDNNEQEFPLTPGHFLTARVEGPVWRQALTAPRGAVVAGAVFVANDDLAHARAVKVMGYVGGNAILTGEIVAGDRVIVSNLDRIADGSPVRVGEVRDGTLVAEPVISGGKP